jgi:hypothetical protein
VTDTGTYVYAVGRNIPADRLAGVEGMSDTPVRTIAHRDLIAVVSTVDLAEFGEAALRENLEDIHWLETTARRHHAVVRRVNESTTAIAPFRLVTIYRSDDAARNRMEELYDELAVVLDRVDGRGEWSVKVYQRAPDGPGPKATTSAGGAGAGVAYLERRRAELREREAAVAHQELLSDELFWDLVPGAAATRRLVTQDQRLSGRSEPMTLNAAFLVDQGRTTEFLRLVDDARSKYTSLAIEVDGPWPPYSFAVLDQT